MPHASHRMDLLVVAARPEQTMDIARVRKLLHSWGVDDRGRLSDASVLIAGGCARIWIDVPGRVTLYANQTGGFRASCHACNENLASTFGRAHLAWKRGGERSLLCPGCGKVIPLEAVNLNPVGAFSSWAIVFSGAGGTELGAVAQETIRGAVGEYQVVLRRP